VKTAGGFPGKSCAPDTAYPLDRKRILAEPVAF